MASNRNRKPQTHKRPRAGGKTRPPSLAERYQKLAQAIAAIPLATELESLPHDVVEAALEFYVDAELRGEPVHETFNAMWKHLRACPRCNLSYSLLKTALELKPPAPDEPTAHAADALSFLAPAQASSLWQRYIRPRTGGAPWRFGVNARAPHIRQTLVPPLSPAVLRESGQETARHLVHSDTFVLGHQEIDLHMWARRSGDRLLLQISLRSPAPLPPGLRATFRWNDRQITLPVVENQARFEQLPATELETADAVSLDFEEIESGSGSERDSEQ